MRHLRSKREGFTLIELMIVVAIIGILAAIAVPAFINFVKRSKTSESAANLKAMFTGAAAYYQNERWAQGVIAPGAAQAASTACVAASSATTNVPSSNKTVINWAADPNIANWEALSFEVADPVYYNYSFVAQQGPTNGCGNGRLDTSIYSFRATGDIDGDGTTSTFELSAGSNASNTLYRSPGFFVTNELE